MARKAKEFQVTLEAIRCTQTQGDGDADTLEIKGHLGSWGSFINAKAELERGSGTVLWTSDKPVNIALNTEIVLNAPTPMFVFERDFLELWGYFRLSKSMTHFSTQTTFWATWHQEITFRRDRGANHLRRVHE